MSRKKEKKKLGMVDWYDPRQLLNTAGKTFISETIGEYADPRTGTADPTPGKFFDYSKRLSATDDDFGSIDGSERTDLWIDYAADVGDGWNSTYAVAHTLARKNLEVEEAAGGRKITLERGEILFFGGDGVYPTATSTEYEQRLVMPYRMAFKASGEREIKTKPDAADLKIEPHVFALPGNHDWYDSLVAFRKLFCSHIFNDRRFAGAWVTRQKRSYFALKLPQKWWLLAVDMQLSHNIDVSQLQYFESIVEKKMEKGDRVILCVPEPYWVKAAKYRKLTDKFEEKEESIGKLENFFEKNNIEVKVYIAGDLHHYRRFENDNDIHKITAGGGGAFLHPTHDYDFRRHRRRSPGAFFLKADYPNFATSRRQDFWNLLFFWNNKTFGIFTAILYALIAILTYAKIDYELSWKAVGVTINNLVGSPGTFVILIAMLGGLVFFTDSNSKWYKWVAGLIHGFVHLGAILFLGWLVSLLSSVIAAKLGVEENGFYWNLVWFPCVVVVSALGGYLLGAVIMGLYLFYSLHFRGRHDNEAFSALKIEDFKHFLRLHIDANGTLTIYPVKIERVPREWKPVFKDGKEIEYYAPEPPINPQLIEKPIVIEPNSATDNKENSNEKKEEKNV